jgi:hypothetical protein
MLIPRSGIMLGLLLAWHVPARAESSTRERLLEARVRFLEQRLQRLEARLDGGIAAAPHHHVVASTKPSGRRSVDESAQALGQVSAPARIAREVPVSAPPAPSLGVGKVADAPQETFVFRTNSVTLRPWRFEADTDFGYLRGNGFLQTDRAATNTTTLRVGILDWLELNAAIPSFITSRTRGVGPFRTRTSQVEGLGDVLIQANARIHEQTADLPGAVLSLGALLPTGTAPYDFTRYQPNPNAVGYNPNPTNLNTAYLSRGAWGIVTHLEFYKTVDPVIVFFGVGANYLFPQTASGHSVQAGVIYDYNLGLSLALSDKSTLGFQVEGNYQGRLSVDGRTVPQSEIEPAVARVSLIQRIFEETWVEPSLAAGLTNNAPGFALDVGFRHRF